MKIILKEEYPSLGVIGEVLKVADGYARNYLFPKGIAIPATKGNLRQYEAMQEVILKKRAKVKGVAEEFAEKLGALELSFTRKSGDGGKLFGSVTSADISKALAEEGFEIDKKYIRLDEHIKSIGTVSVPVKIHSEVPATVKVMVMGEGFEEEVVEAAPEEGEAVSEEAASEEAPETEAVGEEGEALAEGEVVSEEAAGEEAPEPVEAEATEAPAEAVSEEPAE